MGNSEADKPDGPSTQAATQLLARIQDGDSSAAEELLPLASDRAAYRAGIAAAAAALRERDVASAERHLQATTAALRGWEWEHLVSCLDQSVMTLRLQSASSVPPALAMWGSAQAWFGGDDRSVHVAIARRPDEGGLSVETFETATGQPIGRWTTDEGIEWAPASPETIYIQTADGRAALRDAVTGGVRHSLPTLAIPNRIDGPVPSAAFGNAEGLLARIRRLSPARTVFSPSGASVVCATGKRVFVLSRQGADIELEGHPETMSSAAFDPSERHVATVGFDRTLAVYDLHEAGRRAWRVANAHHDAILAVAFSPDGQVIATGGQDRVLRLWDAASGTARGQLIGHREPLLSICFRGDGDQILTCSAVEARLWDPRAAADPFVLRLEEPVRSLALSPDGSLLAAGSTDLCLWDAPSGTPVAVLPMPGSIRRLSFARDGSRLAVAGEVDLEIDMRTGLVCESGADARRLYSSAGPFAVRHAERFHVLDTRMGETVGILPGCSRLLHFGPGGRRLAYSCVSNVIVFDLLARRIERQWSLGLGVPFLLSDAVNLAVVAEDLGIAILNIASGRELAVLRGHTGKAKALAELPGGRRLISGADDRTVRVWNLDTLEEVVTLRGHTDTAWEIAVTADGRTIFSASGDRTIRRWSTAPLRDLLRARAEYARLAARLEPVVERLFGRFRDAATVADRLESDDTLNERERQIVLQLVLRKSVFHDEASTSSEHRNE